MADEPTQPPRSPYLEQFKHEVNKALEVQRAGFMARLDVQQAQISRVNKRIDTKMARHNRKFHEHHDIETKSQDGRRLENRVSTMAVLVDGLIDTIRDQQAQVATLTERSQSQRDAIHQLGLYCRLDQQTDNILAILREGNKPIPPQPAADDAEKWLKVHVTFNEAWGSNERLYPQDLKGLQAAMAEAVKQGLVMRPIDPNDPDLVRVVVDCLFADGIQSYYAETLAPRILSALDVAMGGEK